jgi:hypothetical protein
MATPLLQKARQRKMIYFGAIVALFTLSLIHREFVIKPQATRLQLRETARGEVELTSSAVRLMLTGSRGLAVTFLWYNAMEKQKRSEWNELELIVKSITKLQPYFITPWLYQSWNISFNVAVECDRPRDKYFYISRGLELLAEGERRNSGTAEKGAANDPDRIVIPGNPELRQFMGFIYQLKIGNSDERLTMRSLLELSCIDPVQRNPDKFWTTNEKGQKGVNLAELAKFCQKNPRLVRRLHEQLEYSDPQRIVQFLQDNQNIPSRFKPIEKSKLTNIVESELKDPLDQFPILPPPEGNWPDSQLRDLTSESIDVFLICRTWYLYAQKPLPPADPEPGPTIPVYDKLRFRVPKGMVVQLFRGYPARAQAYIAETLETEGFFDNDGWDMSPTFKKWSNRRDINRADHIYGADPKYHSRLAWQRSYDAYKEYGLNNGIYISPSDLKELNARAEEARKQLERNPEQSLQGKPEWREGKKRESLEALKKITHNDSYRTLTNFDAFLDQSEGEADPIAVAMRKTLFFAERKRKREVASELILELYNDTWNLYTHVCFKYPRFAKVGSVQEDIYEIQIRNALGKAHEVHREKFKNAAIASTVMAFSPSPGPQAAIVQAYVVTQKANSKREEDQQEMNSIFPMRRRYGPLDLIQYYDGPAAKELKEEFLFRWIQGAGLAYNLSVPQALAFPNGHEYYLLTRSTPFFEETPPLHWQALISKESRHVTRERLGINK